MSLAWVGIVLAYVNAYWARTAERDFRREGRRYVEMWADRAAQSVDQPEHRDSLVRRLSAEFDSRTAGVLDLDGRWVVRAGPAVDVPAFPTLSKINDKRLDRDAWLFRAPMWVDGRRAGDVVWVRHCRALLSETQRRRRGLTLAWLWWAVAGGIGVVLARRTGQNGVLGVNTHDDAIDPTSHK